MLLHQTKITNLNARHIGREILVNGEFVGVLSDFKVPTVPLLPVKVYMNGNILTFARNSRIAFV